MIEGNIYDAKLHYVALFQQICLTVRNTFAVYECSVRRAGVCHRQIALGCQCERRMYLRNARIVYL